MEYLPSTVLPLRTGRELSADSIQVRLLLMQLENDNNDSLPDDDHDVLYFLSIVFKNLHELDGTAAMLQVLLPSEKYTSTADGSYCQIAIVPRREVYDWIPEHHASLVFGDDDNRSTAPLIAVKSAKQGKEEDNTTWSTMARECRILRDDHLRQHQNIVRLLGVCWQTSSSGAPLPALIMEAAEMDLDKYFVRGRAVNLEGLIDLAIDVASGIEAIHNVGVIHGDIKPKNILLFQMGQNKWAAKIADFGSSLIYAEVREKVQVQFLSRYWAAPETASPLSADELQQADLFSLGMVLWKILSLNGLITDLEEMAETEDEEVISTFLERLKLSGHLARVAHASVRKRHDRGGRLFGGYTEAAHMADIVSSALGPPSERKDASFYVANLCWVHMATCGTAPEKLRNVLLYCGAEDLVPPPQIHKATGNDNGIPSISNQYSILTALPRSVYDYVIQRLRNIALHSKNKARSLDAGFEYAMNTFETIQVCAQTHATLEEALELLLRAAVANIDVARSVVGQLFTAFGKALPAHIRNQEPQWLSICTEAGSDTARCRLKALDLPGDAYDRAMRRLRLSRYDFQLNIVLMELQKGRHAELKPGAVPELKDYRPRDDQAGLRFCSMSGNYVALNALLLASPNLDLNTKDAHNVTPLMIACIAGHAEVAKQLLRHGADPTIAADNGTTPMHFLCSFDDEDIPVLADALVKGGTSLEARATTAEFGFGTIARSYLRIAKGTPLMFAVAANNLAAVQSLVKHGADPFDILGEKEELSNKIGKMIHHSPVQLATVFYQHEILGSLLGDSAETILQEYLGPREIFAGPKKKAVLEMSMLQWLVDFEAHGLKHRLLLHGAQFREAFAGTFDILVEHGADPVNADGKGASVLENAVLSGQPFVLECLMKWQHGKLMSDPDTWLRLLKKAAESGSIIMFDTLMEHQRTTETKNTDLWLQYFQAVCKHSDNVCFLDPFKAILDDSYEGTDLLWESMLQGHFSVARWIYERTKCDFTRKRDGSTLLGTLLLYSKKYSRIRKALEVLLDFKSLPEDIFYDVTSISGSSLTALQTATYFPEYNAAISMAGRTLQVILERWSEPQYLNYQVPDGEFRGSTALHLAIRTGNRMAVECLLDETEYLDDLDLSLVDVKGYNVYDRAIINLSSQAIMLEQRRLPVSFQEQADLDHWTRSFIILAMVEEIAPRPNRIVQAYVRHELEMFMVLTFEPKLDVKRYKADGGIWPQEIIALGGMFEILSRLEVNEAKFRMRPLEDAGNGGEMSTGTPAVHNAGE